MEKNLCVTLVIYQESLHDVPSTKFKVLLDIIRLNMVLRVQIKTYWANTHAYIIHDIEV